MGIRLRTRCFVILLRCPVRRSGQCQVMVSDSPILWFLGVPLIGAGYLPDRYRRTCSRTHLSVRGARHEQLAPVVVGDSNVAEASRARDGGEFVIIIEATVPCQRFRACRSTTHLRSRHEDR